MGRKIARSRPTPRRLLTVPVGSLVRAKVGTDVKMTSQVLLKLETKGLIEREVDPADARAKRLRVTDRGARFAKRAITAVERVDAAFFRAVPDRTRRLSMLRPLARGDES